MPMESRLKKYLKEENILTQSFEHVRIEVIPRDSNHEVDTLNKYTLCVPPQNEIHFSKKKKGSLFDFIL